MLEAEGAQFSSCTRPPDPGGALIGLLSFLCVLPSTHARLVFEKKEIQARLIWKEGRKMKLHPYTGDTVGIHGKIQEIMNMSSKGNCPRSPRTLTVTVISKKITP